MSSRLTHKGITIIELVIVRVIIAIGAVLMVPNIGAWLPNYRLRSATRDNVSTLRTAQMKAVSTRMDYRVSFNPALRAATFLSVTQGGCGSMREPFRHFPLKFKFLLSPSPATMLNLIQDLGLLVEA
jgi:Tfp pilus assembly protein FimT